MQQLIASSRRQVWAGLLGSFSSALVANVTEYIQWLLEGMTGASMEKRKPGVSMTILLVGLLTLGLMMVVPTAGEAGDVHVQGYYRKNGTYVATLPLRT